MEAGGGLLDGLGAHVLGIVTPVSICMLLVVLLVRFLTPHGSRTPPNDSIAMLVYDEKSSDATSVKFEGALLNAVVFVAVVTMVTFLLVLLYYIRCTKFLRGYMGFSAFTVLGFLGGGIFLQFIVNFMIPIDIVTFSVVLFNFAAVGVLSVFQLMPIVMTQGYLVLIGMFVAFWFTTLPEWTTWLLLVAMALYDIVAVLTPGGPLNLLVKLAIARDEELPALIYESRPPVPLPRGTHVGLLPLGTEDTTVTPPEEPRRWKRRQRAVGSSTSSDFGNMPQLEIELQTASGGVSDHAPSSSLVQNAVAGAAAAAELEDESVPLVAQGPQDQQSSSLSEEGVEESDESRGGFRQYGGLKLGLGDFIFYSVLVGRAAMYDLMTVYASYLAIIAGLGMTLVLLPIWKRALPALPFSIMLGVLFYLVTRFLMEPFALGLSSKLLCF